MVNEEKLRTMSRLAMYEKGEGKKYLPISRYYRSDYVGQALIRNFFLVTIGYALILAVLAIYHSEYLMNNIHRMDLQALGRQVLTGYIALFAVYTLVTFLVYIVRYYKAKTSVRKYYSQLTALDKLYLREDKKNQLRDKTGGLRA